MKTFIAILTAVLIVGVADAQRYERADLLRMMRSGNGKERALARQLLPREGVNRIDEVIAGLSDGNEAAWRTASNILCDIANEVSAPGRDADQKRMADALLAHLAAKPGADVAARILNIVYLVLPEGADVAPIAAYLDDPALQMNARDCLQLAATTEAKTALCRGIDKTEGQGTFGLALIDSVGLLRDPGARNVLELGLRSRDAATRAASARALAWVGDAELVSVYQEVISRATDETYVESSNAFLLLVDAICEKGGRFDYAMEQYSWAAKNLEGPVLLGAAIASMGRYGDERVVPVILDAAKREKDGTLDHAALEALAALRGDVASRAILAHHTELLAAFGPSVYTVYGRRGDPAFEPILLDALNSPDAYAKRVAGLALFDANSAAGIAAVAKQNESLEGEARDQFVDRVAMKAIECREKRNAAAAGAAYAGLYRLATSDNDKKFALAGMMQYPTEEAFALVKDMISENQLAELSVPFLAGIARSLYAANRPEDADRIVDAMTPRIASAEDMQSYLAIVKNAGPELARKLGFVMKWHVVGPFPWSASAAFSENHIDAPDVDLSATIAAPQGDARRWTPREADGNGVVDLTGALGMASNAAAYAYAEIDVAADTDVSLRMGSDDGIKVWVNGAVVHEHHVDRGLAADQDQAAAKLVTGKNKILVEITQGGGGWNMCLRIVEPDGRPLAFTQ